MKKKLKEFGMVALMIVAAMIFLFVADIGCVVRYMTGISCPGCGMTRAFLSLLQLNFEQAWHYHPMIYVLPIFAVVYLFTRRKKRIGNAVLWVAGACFLITYLIRIFILKDSVLEVDIAGGRICRVLRYLKL